MALLTYLKLERVGGMLHMQIQSENNAKDVLFLKEIPKYMSDFIRNILEEELDE